MSASAAAIPNVEASTTQIGLFVQDDWEMNEHLTLNLGLRWDVDTNARNNDFVTSPAAAAGAADSWRRPADQPAFFDVEDYISTATTGRRTGTISRRGSASPTTSTPISAP